MFTIQALQTRFLSPALDFSQNAHKHFWALCDACLCVPLLDHDLAYLLHPRHGPLLYPGRSYFDLQGLQTVSC